MMIQFSLTAAPGSDRRARADIRKLGRVFDLTQDNLGEDICTEATDGVLWNMVQECDSDGNPWAPLSQSYEAWKAIAAPGKPMSVLTGMMRSAYQLDGERFIAADSATQVYGTDAAARMEAEKFTWGGIVTGTRQPPRPFYGLTSLAIVAIDDRFDQAMQSFTITT